LDDSVVVTAAQVLVQARVNTIQSVYLLPLETVRAARDGAAAMATSSLSGPSFDAEMFSVELDDVEYDAPVIRVQFPSLLILSLIYDITHQDLVLILRCLTPVNDVDLDTYRALLLWAPTVERWVDGSPLEVPVTMLHLMD